MTVSELKSLIKEVLLEAVPFDKATDIEYGLKAKYDELGDYTFGVEFEFEPVVEEQNLSTDQIIEKLSDLMGASYSYDNGLTDAYNSWVDEQRNEAAKRWNRYGTIDNIDRYDEEYGPMSVDTFDSSVSEPVESDYATEEEYNEAYKKYDEVRNEVDSEYTRWERRYQGDYVDEYLRLLARSGEWTDFIPDSELNVTDMEGGIDSAYNLLDSLGEDVRKDDKPDKDTWAVGEDGPNVEIRSRHMRQTGNDFNIISKVGNWVSDQATHGKTGMHVHIGVPSDFDMFDVLAMSTLVDENAIKSAVAMDRDFNSFAKLRRSLSNAIYNRIHEYMRRQSENVPKSFTLTNAQMKEVLAHFDRNHGTNIAAFSEHKTIEFRYLGSDMAYQVLKWISYFLLLPRIAKSRNQVKLDTIYNEQIVATRMPGKIKFDLFTTDDPRTRVPMPKEPADVIKQKAFELPSKLDIAKQQAAAKKQSGTQ